MTLRPNAPRRPLFGLSNKVRAGVAQGPKMTRPTGQASIQPDPPTSGLRTHWGFAGRTEFLGTRCHCWCSQAFQDTSVTLVPYPGPAERAVGAPGLCFQGQGTGPGSQWPRKTPSPHLHPCCAQMQVGTLSLSWSCLHCGGLAHSSAIS